MVEIRCGSLMSSERHELSVPFLPLFPLHVASGTHVIFHPLVTLVPPHGRHGAPEAGKVSRLVESLGMRIIQLGDDLPIVIRGAGQWGFVKWFFPHL